MACRIGMGMGRGMVEPPKEVTMKTSHYCTNVEARSNHDVGINCSNLVSGDIFEAPATRFRHLTHLFSRGA